MKNLSISAKLAVAFGVIVIVFGLIFAFFENTLSSTNKSFQSLLDTEFAIDESMMAMRSDILRSASAVKSFRISHDLIYRDHFDVALQAAIKNEEFAKVLVKESNATDTLSKLTAVMTMVKEYQATFKKLVAETEIIGLTPKKGLQGAFRGAAHDLSDVLKELKVEKHYLNLLLLRRWEKDFYRTGAEKYQKRFFASLSDHRQLLQDEPCEKESQVAQEVALAAYEQAFKGLLEADELTKEAAYTKVRTQAHNLEVPIQRIYISGASELLLTMRKHEKDFIMRKSDKYVGKLQKTVRELQKAVAASSLDAGFKSKVSKLISL